MTTFYIIVEVLALLACIIIPLRGPRKTVKTTQTKPELSNLAVNEQGRLEYLHDAHGEEHPTY
jgi:hypothetical protein